MCIYIAYYQKLHSIRSAEKGCYIIDLEYATLSWKRWRRVISYRIARNNIFFLNFSWKSTVPVIFSGFRAIFMLRFRTYRVMGVILYKYQVMTGGRGAFLIRKSRHTSQAYALLVNTGDKIDKFLVVEVKGIPFASCKWNIIYSFRPSLHFFRFAKKHQQQRSSVRNFRKYYFRWTQSSSTFSIIHVSNLNFCSSARSNIYKLYRCSDFGEIRLNKYLPPWNILGLLCLKCAQSLKNILYVFIDFSIYFYSLFGSVFEFSAPQKFKIHYIMQTVGNCPYVKKIDD